MADLGNLYFDILLRDMTDADIDKIKKKLEKVGVKIGVDADRTTLAKNIREALKNRTFKIDIEPNKKIKKASVEVNKSILTKSVTDTLKNKTFKANVELVVKSASVEEAIRQAFAKNGMRYNPLNGTAVSNSNRNLANSYRNAAGAANEFARASVNLSNGLHTNIRFGGQLGTMLGNFASILASQDILQNIVRIGGELENQRIALGAILQDGGKATEMFSKIQSLAVKSPFGVMDLNKYVKQLSAYSVPYNELYETMKRLTDISAGVGVDMGRIILAFGQVKAAGFLKGTELRQFTEANIPMVDKLAERFTHLTGEIVTAGEVYDMISKKKVTFEDVKSVLWDLTDEGGMFNNMQEVLSESLASKWKNLADAIDVMLGKIADGGVGNGLKSLAEILTSLTKQWEKLGVAISAVSTVFFSRKLGSSIMAYSLASVKGSTRELQKELILLRNRAKTEMAATGNIFSKFVISTKRDFAMAGASLRAFGNNFSAMIKRIGVSLKALTLNFLPFAAMTALFEGIYYFINKSQESAERIKDISSAAFEGFDNLSNKIKSIGDDMPKTAAGIASSIEKMETAIKDYAPNSDFILGGINKADSKGDYVYGEAERYKMLNQALKDTQEAYRILATEMEGFSEAANKATDGLLDHSFIRNVKDASDAMQSYKQALNDISSVGLKYESAINKAKEADAEFATATEGKSIKQIFDLLKDYEVAYKTFYEEAAKIGMGGVHFDYAVKKLKEQQKVALDDTETWIEKYKGLLQSEGWDLNNLSQARRIAISIDVTKFLNSIEGLDDETKKLITTRILEKEFKIKLTSEELQAVNAKTKKDYDESKDEVAKLWKKRAEEIDKAVAAYDKWKKIESASKAEQRIKGMDEFANLFNGKYGFSLGLEDPTDAYRYIQSKLNKNLSAQNEVYIALGVKLNDSEFKDAEESLKIALDKIKENVKKVTSQWNFYEDMFRKTGNKELSMNIAFGEKLDFENEIEYFRSKIEAALTSAGSKISFKDVIGFTDKQLEESGLSLLKDYVEAYRKAEQDQWKNTSDRLIKAIEENMAYSEKIKLIQKQSAEDITAIEKQRTKDNGEYIDILIKNRKKLENQELHSLSWSEFKKTDEYVQVFENLDRMPVQTIEKLIEKLEEMKGSLSELKLTELKELISALEKLKKEAEERNPFAVLSKSLDALSENSKDDKAWVNLGVGIESSIKYVKELSQAFSEAFELMGITASKQGKVILDGLENLGLGFAKAAESYGKKDWVGMASGLFNAASGMAKVYSGIFSDKESKEAEKQFMFDLIRLQTEYNSKLVETKLLNDDVWDNTKINDAIDAVDALSQAVEYYDELLNKQVEKHQDPSGGFWKNMGKWNFWNPFGWWSSAFGSVVDGDNGKEMVAMMDNLRYITKTPNLFRHTQTTNLVEWLKDNGWGELFDEDGRLNIELATTIKDWDRLTDETKEYLNNLIEAEEAIQNAEDALSSYISDTFGDLGKSLSDSIVNAFRNGKDAAKDFKDSVVNVLEDIGAQILRSVFLADIFKKYQSQLETIYKNYSKDGDEERFSKEMADITSTFFKESQTGIEAGMKWLETYQDIMKNYGFEVFKPTSETSASMSKAIQGVSENTAELLSSYINDIRANVSVKRALIEKLIVEDIPQMSILAKEQLTQLNNIAANTLRNAEAADRIYDLVNRVVDKSGNKLKI